MTFVNHSHDTSSGGTTKLAMGPLAPLETAAGSVAAMSPVAASTKLSGTFSVNGVGA